MVRPPRIGEDEVASLDSSQRTTLVAESQIVATIVRVIVVVITVVTIAGLLSAPITMTMATGEGQHTIATTTIEEAMEERVIVITTLILDIIMTIHPNRETLLLEVGHTIRNANEGLPRRRFRADIANVPHHPSTCAVAVASAVIPRHP